MKGSTQAIYPHTETGFQEYELVIFPCDALKVQLQNEQTSLIDLYGGKPGTLQLELAGFQAREYMEETLCRWFRNICKIQERFVLSFNNYSSLHSGSVYLRLVNWEPLEHFNLQLNSIDGFLRGNECPPLKLHQPKGFIISGPLSIEKNREAAGDYGQRSFSATLQVDKIVLIKKLWDSFKVVDQFMLSAVRD